MSESKGDIIVVDIESSPLTLSDVMSMIEECKNSSTYAGYDIFVDGDRRAIVARPKVRTCQAA